MKKIHEGKMQFRNPLWMKVAIIVGTPLFLLLTGYIAWACILGFSPANGYFLGVILLPVIAMFGYLTYLGILLLRDINIVIEPMQDGFTVHRGKSSRHYRWRDIKTLKKSNMFQVVWCIDKKRKRIFTVDYIFKGSGYLFEMIQQNLSTEEPTTS